MSVTVIVASMTAGVLIARRNSLEALQGRHEQGGDSGCLGHAYEVIVAVRSLACSGQILAMVNPPDTASSWGDTAQQCVRQ